MKKKLLRSLCACWWYGCGLAPLVVQAATNPPPPVVTVMVTNPHASEQGPTPGVFTVTRSGLTNDSLTVFYSLGGGTRNGRDYQMLPGYVKIAAGSVSAEITVMPFADNDWLPNTNETVVLQLHQLVDPPSHRQGLYAIGWPSNAVLTISENSAPTNSPPVVRITGPEEGETFLATSTITLTAQAKDAVGTVTNVQFFAGTNNLGSAQIESHGHSGVRSASLQWSNVVAGRYVLTAKATDDRGLSTTSAPVTINVLSAASLPVVTVTATVTNASEIGPVSGAFLLQRTGDTTGALAVHLSLGGTAKNGVDYQKIASVANFPAGSNSVTVTVVPIPDLDAVFETNETVVLQLQPVGELETDNPGLYLVGSPSNAVVTIAESTNALPVITVVATQPNASEDGPKPGTFLITRTGKTNDALEVFYSLGGSAENGKDYQMLPGFAKIPAGTNSVAITVTPLLDVDRTKTTNDTVVLQLRALLEREEAREQLSAYALGWPSNALVTIAESTNAPANLPPVVRILSPADGAGFVAGDNIKLVAQARDADGSVTNVQFFSGTNNLGVATSVTSDDDDDRASLFVLKWTNVVVGEYTLTAKATDDQGAATTSSAIHVSVTATALPKVTITTHDAVAFINTNRSTTNSATFVVRRDAGTNADLVVYYAIGGTASNGVDYVKAPNSVTILAGHHTASIPIVPLANAPESKEILTIVLSLQAPPTSNSTPPTYRVDRPGKASAIIADDDDIRHSSRRVGKGLFHLALKADSEFPVRLEASADMVNWTPVSTGVATNGEIHFVDPDAPGFPKRFYRVVPDPTAPSDHD